MMRKIGDIVRDLRTMRESFDIYFPDHFHSASTSLREAADIIEQFSGHIERNRTSVPLPSTSPVGSTTNNFPPPHHFLTIPKGWKVGSLGDPLENHVRAMLTEIGEDPKREGLVDTPKRVAKSWRELFDGYGQNPGDVFKAFEDGACDEIVILRDIHFTSFCEHHLLPFTGKAHIGYLPDKKVIGVSKLARLLEIFTHRMQIQERIGIQVCDALEEHLKPRGCGIVIEASHSCLECRGIKKSGATLVTSAVRGLFMTNPQCREEFLRACRM